MMLFSFPRNVLERLLENEFEYNELKYSEDLKRNKKKMHENI